MGIRSILKELNENIMLAEGFDEAFMGVAQRAGLLVAAYDRGRIIDILARDMTREDAEEYFEFNVAGAWVGEHSPVYIDTRYAD